MPGSVHPERLREPLAGLRLHHQQVDGDTLLPFVPRAAEVDQQGDKRLGMLAKIIGQVSSIHAAATGIMQLEPWDFMGVYYDGLDHFGHAFMRYHPPHDPRVTREDFEIYHHVVEGGYRFHDLMLGALLALAGEETNIVVLSDHGFHPDHLRPRTLPNAPAGPAAEHREYGILVAAGPDFHHDGREIHTGSLLDIAPTLLHLFGLAVGQDMGGKVLTRAFREDRPINFIPSWDAVAGEDGSHPPGRRINAREAEAAVRQLVDLGYIDEPPEDKDRALAETVRELDYNLAQAYVDGKQFVAAREIARDLHARWPEESRFGMLLLQCEFAVGDPATVAEVFARVEGDRLKYAAEAREELKSLRDEIAVRDPDDVEPLPEPMKARLRRLTGRAHVDHLALAYHRARVLALQGETAGALEAFLKLQDTWPGRQTALFMQIGNALMKLSREAEAADWFRRVLDLDDDHATAHHGLARALLAEGADFAAAAHALESIKLRFENPRAHYHYGVALWRLGHRQWAIEALEEAARQNPHFPAAHDSLAEIYSAKPARPALAAEHREKAKVARDYVARHRQGAPPAEEAGARPPGAVAPDLRRTIRGKADPHREDCVTVVSGLPRSGTSLAMQMLLAGGIPALADDARPADESNQRGYFEYAPVKSLGRHAEWIDHAIGKAVKIVVPLVKFLPAGRSYRVILMEREFGELMESQGRMLAQLGKEGSGRLKAAAAQLLFQQWQTCREALTAMPGTDLLIVSYNDLIDAPDRELPRISEFLDLPAAATARMRAAIDPGLYRSRRPAVPDPAT